MLPIYCEVKNLIHFVTNAKHWPLLLSQFLCDLVLTIYILFIYLSENRTVSIIAHFYRFCFSDVCCAFNLSPELLLFVFLLCFNFAAVISFE